MRGPMDPQLIEAWSKGRKAGLNEATEIFSKFLSKRTESLKDLPGVGEKTFLKVFNHFNEGFEIND